MSAKYIIVKRGDLLSALVFSESETHNDIRIALGVSIENVHSAGFVEINSNGAMIAYGESVSIGVGTAKDSTKVLNAHLNHG